MNLKLLAGLVAILGISSTAIADDEFRRFTITPSANYFSFDSEANLDNDQGYGLGFGYRIDPQWEVMLNYQYNNANVDTSILDVEYEMFSLDAISYFGTEDGSPFIRFGLGDLKKNPEQGLEEEDTVLKLGLGLKKLLNKRVSLTLEFQSQFGMENSELNHGLVLGLSYAFGAYKKKPVVIHQDSDKDGVPNHKDACDEVLPPGKKVDQYGCIIE